MYSVSVIFFETMLNYIYNLCTFIASSATAASATHSGAHSGQLRPILRRAASVGPDDRPIAPMPAHWSTSR